MNMEGVMNRGMLNYWTIFLIVASGLEYAHCNVKCYSCSTQDDARCLNPEDKLELRKCNKDAMMEMKGFAEKIDVRYREWFEVDLHTLDPLIPLKCMKQVTIVRGKEYIIRGCQLDSGQPDICTVVTNESKRQNIGNVTHCSLCNGEACNFAPTTSKSLGITTILASALVPKLIFF